MSVAVITLPGMSAAVIIEYDRGMTRWEPDSRSRLEQAALALFGERGFENTTVAEIAARAGLTERTFFRYFADKREVLFSGAGTLQDLLVSAVLSARFIMRSANGVVAWFNTSTNARTCL